MGYKEKEAELLRKSWLLPNQYKFLGAIMLIVFGIGLVITVFIDNRPFWLRAFIMNGIVGAMLVISISKDRLEDEYIVQLRAQSYALAFIIGVIYTIFQPYVNYSVAYLIKGDEVIFESMESFVIVWFMLFIQLGFFHLLKSTR